MQETDIGVNELEQLKNMFGVSSEDLEQISHTIDDIGKSGSPVAALYAIQQNYNVESMIVGATIIVGLLQLGAEKETER